MNESVVQDFINERPQYITAIENCAPDNTPDYWRWQGHAEARRQLSERLSAITQKEQPKRACILCWCRDGSEVEAVVFVNPAWYCAEHDPTAQKEQP